MIQTWTMNQNQILLYWVIKKHLIISCTTYKIILIIVVTILHALKEANLSNLKLLKSYFKLWHKVY